MITKKMIVNIKESSDAKPPIAMFVQVASQYESKIYLELEDKKINAKSIMGMMSLQLGNGEELTVVADGEDEADAIQGVEKLLVTE